MRDLTWSSWAARGRKRDTELDRERQGGGGSREILFKYTDVKERQVDKLQHTVKTKGRKGEIYQRKSNDHG